MTAQTNVLEKPNSSKNLIKYFIVLAVFLGALWLSFQNESPSKFPKEITDGFTFTAWVNDGEDYLKKDDWNPNIKLVHYNHTLNKP